MPLHADIGKLSEIAGFPVEISPTTHALHAIAAVHKILYDNRTGVNRAVRAKEAKISQLHETVPEAPGGVSGDEASMPAQHDAARAARHAALEAGTRQHEWKDAREGKG